MCRSDSQPTKAEILIKGKEGKLIYIKQLIDIYYAGNDMNSFFTWCLKAALKDDIDGMYRIGYAYEVGKGQ